MAKLADEIQSKPFAHPEEEAMLNIVRTADLLLQLGNKFLKQFDISGPQYNVLRILRGSPAGLSCGQIAERMISRDPDVTRLLDRLEARGLLARERSGQDRRVVITRITAAGLELIATIDPQMIAQHGRQMGALGEQKLRQLIELLEEVRDITQTKEEINESHLPD